ncbi:tropinone reductase-like 3 isoform X2 [Cryptomeria japonica]|uniref:tropinone reductase-like 3 isoform X2 n=1 Tax=Cryptomeria japonica TaxID=3369 RepID=UPI0025AB9D93|nr:tropinone reductase-like 3 isoform X2 [Cryptomeria japonica]
MVLSSSSTMKRFSGKVAVVTASTQGIGFAIALRLGMEGASVVVSSRKPTNVDNAVQQLADHGITDVLGVPCHVSDAQQRKRLIQSTLDEAVPHMPRGSSITMISSIAAYQPQATMTMYGVTKTALLGLTKALAAELAPDIRVNTVAPGFVPTHFADFLVRNEDIKKAIEEKTLLGRLGKTSDMASAVAFLASSDASYITGETLVVAGGVPSRL